MDVQAGEERRRGSLFPLIVPILVVILVVIAVVIVVVVVDIATISLRCYYLVAIVTIVFIVI